MQVYFDNCNSAIDYALKTESFGLFRGEKHIPDSEMHLHNSCEILFCLSEGKTFIIGERIYEIHRGDVFFMSQFEAHKVAAAEAHEPFMRVVIQLHPAYIYSISTAGSDMGGCFNLRGDGVCHKISLTEPEIADVLSVLQELESETEFADDVIKNAAMMKLMAMFNRKFLETNKGFKQLPPYENEVVEKCLLYINENFAGELNLETIAKNAYISTNQLCRLFQKHLGTTAGKYVMSKRMTEAKKMLRIGKTVSDVAMLCGFKDYSNFIRSFKKTVGVSPGQYAKQLYD